MPDLNLQDDEGSLDNLESAGGEELTVSEDEGPPKKKSSALTVVLVLLVVVIVGAGGAYLLNRLGVIKLWGTRAAPEVVQMEGQPAQAESMAQDTTGIAMVETPPLDDTKKPPTKTAVRPSQPAKQMPGATVSPGLREMKGEFTVQVSAWRDKEKAQDMVRRLEEAGYPAFVEERSFKDEAWYTVRIGRYASLKDAQLAVGNFAEELRSSYWIDRIRAR